MVAVLTANNPAGRDNSAPAPKLKSDGSNYVWRMFFDEGRQIADADTVGELLELFIPGYLAKDERSKLAARILHARGIQGQLRANILASLTAEEEATLTTAEKNVLYANAGVDLVGWGDKVEGEDNLIVDVWSSEIPMVALDTSYVPFTNNQRPLSSYGDFEMVPNIVMLRPSNELAYLQSLNIIGAVQFGTPAPAPVGETRRVR